MSRVAFGALGCASTAGASPEPAEAPKNAEPTIAPAPPLALSPPEPSPTAAPAPSGDGMVASTGTTTQVATPDARASGSPVASEKSTAPGRLVPGGLARGTGDATDAELSLGDQAYRKGDVGRAREHYQAAQKLAPKDPAPAVGLLRVRFASGDLPTDYGAAPKDPKLRALIAEVEAVLRRSPDYGPAHVERGRLLLVQGKAEAAAGCRRSGGAVGARRGTPGDGQGGARARAVAPRGGARSG